TNPHDHGLVPLAETRPEVRHLPAVEDGPPSLEVLAGAERLAGAGDDDRADRAVALGLAERCGQSVQKLLVERVENRRPVQGENCDALLSLDQEDFLAHGSAPRLIVPDIEAGASPEMPASPLERRQSPGALPATGARTRGRRSRSFRRPGVPPPWRGAPRWVASRRPPARGGQPRLPGPPSGRRDSPGQCARLRTPRSCARSAPAPSPAPCRPRAPGAACRPPRA